MQEYNEDYKTNAGQCTIVLTEDTMYTWERNGILTCSYADTKRGIKNSNASDDDVRFIIWREDPCCDAVSLVISGIL